jgi:hypothetical protein
MLTASFCALMMVMMVWMMVAPMARSHRKPSREATHDGDDSNEGVS